MLADDLNRYDIILATSSPRRQQLLKELGIKFRVEIREWSEDYPENLKGEEIAIHIAREKASEFRPGIRENEIVITADTIVWFNDRILDKPSGYYDAVRILNEISGKTHEVITAVCLLSSEKLKSFSSTTKVSFEKFSREEIDYYIKNFHPFDKAGGYGIQEWIGLAACSRIEGSYFNVMGLPVDQVYRELRLFISGTPKSPLASNKT
jgi:septum formation protein